MSASYQFHATARWTGNRRGIVQSEGVEVPLQFSSPPEFNGELGRWTPEHLLVGSVATCFTLTFRAIAEFSHFEFVGLEVSVDGTLEKQEGGFRFSQMTVRPVLDIGREEDRERAIRMLEKAEKACLISRSLNAKMVLEPAVHVMSGASAD